ncbi:MAG: hypothetical protein LBN06_11030 [Prevotellaceae bacterium]|jgi:hypothetical protein|nr:hypothetical protein [Prevotellaceae bacterium]
MSRCFKSLISHISSLTFSVSDSIDSLLSQTRIFIALYRLAAIHNCDHEYADMREWSSRSYKLFEALSHKGTNSTLFSERCQLLTALYLLNGETGLSYERKTTALCRTASETLFADYGNEQTVHHEKEAQEALFCRCITDYYYPEAATGESLFDSYQDILSSWSVALSADSWSGLSDLTALARLEVMNRNSYMFRHHEYDIQIAQAYKHYTSRILRQTDLPLHTLGILYDVVMQGNAYPVDRALAGNLADELHHRSQTLPTQSDEWLYAISYYTDYRCEQLTNRLQEELIVD